MRCDLLLTIFLGSRGAAPTAKKTKHFRICVNDFIYFNRLKVDDLLNLVHLVGDAAQVAFFLVAELHVDDAGDAAAV